MCDIASPNDIHTHLFFISRTLWTLVYVHLGKNLPTPWRMHLKATLRLIVDVVGSLTRLVSVITNIGPDIYAKEECDDDNIK